MSAFGKDIVRSIGRTLGRFLAIAGIVALGCGFYAGLRMTAPDMLIGADTFYDSTDLYDLRLSGTLGWTQDQVDVVGDVEGVEAVMSAKSIDVMARIRTDQMSTRITGLNMAAADAQTRGIEPTEPILNRPVLAEGRFAATPDECVISADHVSDDPVQVGDTVTVEYGTRDLDGVLERRTFTVVGLVHSSFYVSASLLGSTTLGSGELQEYVYVDEAAFSADYPATEIYVTVEGARDAFSGSDEYYRTVDAVAERLSGDIDGATLAQRRLDQVREEPQAELDKRKAELADGEAAYAEGLASYERARADAAAQIDDARTQLDAASAQGGMYALYAMTQVNTLMEAADSAQTQLDDAAAELARNRARLDDAAAQIADAQQRIDDIALPDVYVLDRTKNMGTQAFEDDAGRVDSIARVFPFIFFLVAALVALTTMTRMVDEERVLIGTYKALGYGRARITSKYLIYAAAASTAGAVVGVAVLSQVLPYVICTAYRIIYNVPTLPLPLPIDWPLAGIAAGMGIGITLVATLAAAMATLREVPAALMLPRAPAAGKRILLERTGILWRRLSFSWKVTCRNIFRYKKRLAMTVIGIGGCTALLLTGLGLSDSINDIIDKHFGPVLRYNTTVTAEADVDDESLDDLATRLLDSGDVDDITRIRQENYLVVDDRDGSTLMVTGIAAQDVDGMARMVSFHERTSGAAIPFDADSCIVTEKLAGICNVGVGDDIAVYAQDVIGNATGTPLHFTVTGIMENYVGNQIYVGSSAFERATGETPRFPSFFARSPLQGDDRTAFGDRLREDGIVETVAFNDETIRSYRTMLRSVNMIVVVLVVCAAALAFIVLYNLTNINIAERQREIASLKVLGFTRREVDLYIFREIAILTVLGALMGLVLGIGLEGFVVTSAEVAQVMFGRDIHPASFAAAFALTLVFAAFVMVVMRRKLDRIDMVESLKSVD